MQDLRYALRSLRKQPIFSLVAILTLTLGIGANTAIFSLLYQALLRPLPYPDAGRLVFVWNRYSQMGLPQAAVSIPDFLDRKAQAPAIEDATLFTNRGMTLAGDGRPEQLRGLAVTPSFFSTFRRQPFLGRGFTDDEAKTGADKFVILTYTLWKSRFGADPAIVGRDVRLNAEPYRVVGVLPADFDLPARDISVLVPFSFTPAQTTDNERGNEFSSMIARMRPGATIDQVNAQIKTIVDRNLERLPNLRGFAETSGFGGFAIDMRQQIVRDVRTPLYILQVGVVLLLLIACANVANLLLMRATGRGREIAIRTTLGAGQWRLVKQMVVEGL
ncbi:MAG TPA: ABC transporter permease, partial [Vicinamibacterales bacterium]